MDFKSICFRAALVAIVISVFIQTTKADIVTPPVLGDYGNVVTGTESGEQLYYGNTSDHLIGLGGADQLFGLGGNDKLEECGEGFHAQGDFCFAGVDFGISATLLVKLDNGIEFGDTLSFTFTGVGNACGP